MIEKLLIVAYQCKSRLGCKDGSYGGYHLFNFLYNMKPLKNTIPIRELQTLLRQWRKRGIREAALPKVLDLYLGLPDYMNEKGEYPVHFFYDLSRSLKFHTVTSMLEAVKMSGSFEWIPGNNKMNVDAVCSPLWKTMDAKNAESIEDLRADLRANLHVGSKIFNINNNHTSSPPEGNPSEEGKKFFHEIKMNPVDKAEILEPLVRFFQEQEAGVSREEACKDVVYLVNELLIPHFVAQEKFFRMKHNGRLVWLRNLLKSGHGKELMRKASEAGRQRRVLKQRQEQISVMLNNRPLSPYEWTDPVSGTRFYEDEMEGRVTIPADAPPRPDERAFWNVIQYCWSNEDKMINHGKESIL